MTFEVYRKPSGIYAWRVRDEEGNVVPMRPGPIAVPPDPELDGKIRAALQDYFRMRYEEQQSTGR